MPSKISLKKSIYADIPNKMRSRAEDIFHKIRPSRISFLNFNTQVTNVIHKSHERISGFIVGLTCQMFDDRSSAGNAIF